MSQKTYSLISGIIFALVALAHLARLAQGWPIVIGNWDVPYSVSWAGLVIPGILAYYGLRFGTRE